MCLELGFSFHNQYSVISVGWNIVEYATWQTIGGWGRKQNERHLKCHVITHLPEKCCQTII